MRTEVVNRWNPMSSTLRRDIVVAGLIGGVVALATIVMLARVETETLPAQLPAYVVPYDQRVLDDPLEVMLARSDGQAFATLARDPTLSRAVEEFRTPGQAAFRAQRPLAPYLAWALSAGRPHWVAPALAVMAVLGTAAMAAATGALIGARGGPPALGGIAALLPGAFAVNSYLGPDALAIGLVLFGLVTFERDKVWTAVGLMTLAALGRETMLVVPAVLFVADLLQRRHPIRWPLVIPGVAWASWVAVVWVRVGDLPTGHGDGALGMPMRGIIDGFQNSIDGGGPLLAAMFAGLILSAIAIAPKDRYAHIALVYLLLSTMLGVRVWMSWYYFGRLLLPALCLALAVVIGWWARRRDLLADRALATQEE